MNALKKVLTGQVARFALVGVGSTVLNLVLFAALHPVMGSQPANALALILCTIANTAVNGRFTFERHRANRVRVQVQSLLLLAVTWSCTALALDILQQHDPHASTMLATITVAIGNAIATIIRFVLLRRWFAAGSPANSASAR